MNNIDSVLLLVGSPRGQKSTSNSIGQFLLEKMKSISKDLKTETIYIHRIIKSKKNIETLPNQIKDFDLLILCFPLYVDSLPFPVIRAMELIAEDRKKIENPKKQKFIAIANCGFPESHHNEVALEICEQFAKEVNFDWLGALALGMGGMIGGAPIANCGYIVRYASNSLRMTAESIVRGEAIPQEAVSLMAKPSIPRRLYVFVGNRSWKKLAKRNNVLRKINDQPY